MKRDNFNQILSDCCASFNLKDVLLNNFLEIYFREDLLLLYKCWHTSRRFIFAVDEILIISRRHIFTVVKHVLIIP